MTPQDGSVNNDTAILIVSCDRYHDLWQPFVDCLFQYWPDCEFPVYLGCNFKVFKDARVRQVLVGEDRDYSSNLIAMIEQIDCQRLIIWVDDRVLVAPPNSASLQDALAYSRHEDVAYVKLIDSPPFAYQGEDGHWFGAIQKGSMYRVAMTVALWRRDALLRILKAGESPWELERLGSVRSNDLSSRFLGVSVKSRHMAPIKEEHLIIKGRLTRQGRAFLRAKGLEGPMSERELQSRLSFIYVSCYSFCWVLYPLVRSYLSALKSRLRLRWAATTGRLLS